MIKITFPNGDVKEYQKGISTEEIAQSISPSLKKRSVAGIVNGELYDFNRPIQDDAKLVIVTKDSKEGFEVLNHSTAHLLADAVKRLYPNATFGVGPAIEEGFYYDINPGENEVITEEDLTRIENEMKQIVKDSENIKRIELSRKEALAFFAHDKYKTELIKALPEGEVISLYNQGEFTDLCRGGHLTNVSGIKYFKLLSIAGAYWRGDSKNEQLQRIYGTSWYSQKELDDYLVLLQERKERDHRKLGKELRLFEIVQESGQGLALWLPNGYTIRKILEDYSYKLQIKAGYQFVSTPALGTKRLYEISGHWSHYRENMFPVMERDDETFVLRPMSCPHHMLVYKSELRSYRDLPIRYAENVLQHRYEASGALTGLERVRAMNLTDAHLFVRPDQIREEVEAAYKLIETAINDLGLEVDYIELALRDPLDTEKYHDDDALWNMAEDMLRDVLNQMKVEYVEMSGEAAFYGPKIDFQVKTAMGKIITMSTVQLDFLLPDRFDLTYIDSNGDKVRPVVIHRGLISTYERLLALLIEQYKGAFPMWLAPKQISIIPVNLEYHADYAKEIADIFMERDIRFDLDVRNEKLGYKIRESQTNKIPYSIVLGDKEVEDRTVTYRKFGEQKQVTVSLEAFIDLVNEDVKLKRR